MADGRHFENRLIVISGATVKISNFWKSKRQQPPYWNSQKNTISPQLFDQSLGNLLQWCKMGLLTAPIIKKFELKKQDSGRSPFLEPLHRYISATIDRLWWNLARWRILAPYNGLTVKFRIFEHPRWQRPPSWKSQTNRNISATVWPIFTKFGTVMDIGP